jgi:hypothetical protein
VSVTFVDLSSRRESKCRAVTISSSPATCTTRTPGSGRPMTIRSASVPQHSADPLLLATSTDADIITDASFPGSPSPFGEQCIEDGTSRELAHSSCLRPVSDYPLPRPGSQPTPLDRLTRCLCRSTSQPLPRADAPVVKGRLWRVRSVSRRTGGSSRDRLPPTSTACLALAGTAALGPHLARDPTKNSNEAINPGLCPHPAPLRR